MRHIPRFTPMVPSIAVPVWFALSMGQALHSKRTADILRGHSRQLSQQSVCIMRANNGKI